MINWARLLTAGDTARIVFKEMEAYVSLAMEELEEKNAWTTACFQDSKKKGGAERGDPEKGAPRNIKVY